jgi:protein gp37
MGKDSRIEWTHHTFNPWWGCVKVSAACDHCYAETWAKRLGEQVWGAKSERRFFSEAHWKEPLRWNKEAIETKTRRRVFCASMADVFENREDLIPHRLRLLELIENTPQLDWLILTKRIHLVKKQLPKGYEFPKNVWLGATVENQETANKRIKYLLEFKSPSVRFLSCEPLLSQIDIRDHLIVGKHGTRIDWVIAGGESGPGSRAMDPAWPEDLQNQCAKEKVPFHFKQWGHWAPLELVSDMLKKHTPIQIVRRDGSEVSLAAIGKGKSGRVLSGRHWDQFPSTIKHKTKAI